MKKKLLALLAVAGAVLAAIGYGYKSRYAMSIGIIGGADGPTAIFVAGKTGLLFYLGLAVLLTALILSGIYLWNRRK